MTDHPRELFPVWTAVSDTSRRPGRRYPRVVAAPIRTGDEVELRVDSLAYGGNGVGRLDGFVVFVRGGLPGDLVRARRAEGTTVLMACHDPALTAAVADVVVDVGDRT